MRSRICCPTRLHEHLTARFVDRRAAHLMRRLEGVEVQDLLSAVTRRGEVIVEGHPVGRVAGFRFFPDPEAEGDEKKLVLRAARRALRDEMPRRVAVVETAADDALTLTDDLALTWDGAPIAKLQRGNNALRPRVQILDSEFLDGAQRERLRLRLQKYLDDRIARDLAPLRLAVERAATQPDLRGMLHRLTESLGLIPGDEGDALPPRSRAALKAIGVKAGRFGLFLPALLKPRAGRHAPAVVVRAAWPRGARHCRRPIWCRCRSSRIGRPGSPRPWAGCKPARCCCASISPSGSPRNWPGRRGGLPPLCRPASRRASR